MPIAFLFIGAIFIVAAIRGTHKELFEIMRDDFFGSPSFFSWGLAFVFIGLMGFNKTFKPVSDAFLVLLFVVIFLRSGEGFFDKLTTQIRN